MAQANWRPAPQAIEKDEVDVRRLETKLDGPILIELVETRRRARLLRRDLPAGQVRRAGDPRASSSRTTTRAPRRTSCAGMHFQLGDGVAKLVRCGRGAIYDVVVDLRRGSPTYGQAEGFELTEDNMRVALLPGRLRPRLLHAERGRRRRSTSRASTTRPARRPSSATGTRRSASSGRSRSRSCRPPRRTRRPRPSTELEPSSRARSSSTPPSRQRLRRRVRPGRRSAAAIASEEVAAGEGALRTCSARSVAEKTKSSTSPAVAGRPPGRARRRRRARRRSGAARARSGRRPRRSARRKAAWRISSSPVRHQRGTSPGARPGQGAAEPGGRRAAPSARSAPRRRCAGSGGRRGRAARGRAPGRSASGPAPAARAPAAGRRRGRGRCAGRGRRRRRPRGDRPRRRRRQIAWRGLGHALRVARRAAPRPGRPRPHLAAGAIAPPALEQVVGVGARDRARSRRSRCRASAAPRPPSRAARSRGCRRRRRGAGPATPLARPRRSSSSRPASSASSRRRSACRSARTGSRGSSQYSYIGPPPRTHSRPSASPARSRCRRGSTPELWPVWWVPTRPPSPTRRRSAGPAARSAHGRRRGRGSPRRPPRCRISRPRIAWIRYFDARARDRDRLLHRGHGAAPGLPAHAPGDTPTRRRDARPRRRQRQHRRHPGDGPRRVPRGEAARARLELRLLHRQQRRPAASSRPPTCWSSTPTPRSTRARSTT